MYRKPPARQETCFIPGSLSDYVPEDHILKQVHAVLDLRWLEQELKGLYAEYGRPGLAPEQVVRLMLAGFFHGVVKDRALLREAQVNLAYRWFAGYALDEEVPDHSSFTRIRQRWGETRFRKIFEKSVTQCVEAGLVGGQVVHADASLIRADVSWSSLVTEHVDRVLAENEVLEETPASEEPAAVAPEKPSKPAPPKKMSTTDPEASMATSHRTQRLEPCYKQHTVVDDRTGIIVDVEVTTGAVSESRELMAQLARVTEQVGQAPAMVTADRAYASSANYTACEEAGIPAVIPPQPEPAPRTGMPVARFAYDARHDRVRCPAGKHLVRTTQSRHQSGWFYRASRAACQQCPRSTKCVPATARARSVLIAEGYPALLRARRRKAAGWTEAWKQAYRRHRTVAEGLYGEAKESHGLRRAVRRGRANVRIQAYLTAAVMNLKRLARAVAATLRPGPNAASAEAGGGSCGHACWSLIEQMVQLLIRQELCWQ